MKNNKSGKLPFLCSAAICISMLAGCSDSNSSSVKDKAESSSAAQTTAATTTTATSEAESEGSDSSQTDTTQPSDITPAMWTVTSDDGHTITLIGSMHALNDSDFPLPDKIMDAYENCDTLAVECDMVTYNKDIVLQLALAKDMMYDDGTTLSDVLSADAYSAVEGYVKSAGQTMDMYQIYKPWAFSSVLDALSISVSGLNSSKGFDAYLLAQAHSDEKEIYEVESVEFQLNLLRNLSVETYDMLFCNYTNQTVQTQADLLNQMHDAWRNGDTDKILQLNSAQEDEDGYNFSDEQLALADDYNKQLLDDRNVGMEQAVKDLLEQDKNVLYVVGAAHFVGDKGIISMLESDGYKVERVEY